jgi:hypothetical protein
MLLSGGARRQSNDITTWYQTAGYERNWKFGILKQLTR